MKNVDTEGNEYITLSALNTTLANYEPLLPSISGKGEYLLRVNEGETAKEWWDIWQILYRMDMGYASRGENVTKDVTYYTSGDHDGNVETITYKKSTTTLAVATYTYTLRSGQSFINYIDLVIGGVTYRKLYAYDGNDVIINVTITIV